LLSIPVHAAISVSTISLKNAAKCDKWYQLQNHLITESLNAKGAREKALLLLIPVHAGISVSTKISKKQNYPLLGSFEK